MNQYVIIGLIVNSALYLGSVFTAALLRHNDLALYLALGSMGVTYLSYFVQTLSVSRAGAIVSVGASVLLGAAAGVALIK